MEYITAKRFLEQPKGIQEMFKRWWEPKQFDLAIHSIAIQYNKPSIIVRKNNDYHIVIVGEDGITITVKDDLIPLLTEGQLRKFIENKLPEKISNINYSTEGEEQILTIEYEIDDIEGYKTIPYVTNCKSLFDGYWKIACNIAKEETVSK